MDAVEARLDAFEGLPDESMHVDTNAGGGEPPEEYERALQLAQCVRRNDILHVWVALTVNKEGYDDRRNVDEEQCDT